jgi:ribosomal protein L9
MATSPGAYKGIPIKAGTDAEIQAQIRAIDAQQSPTLATTSSEIAALQAEVARLAKLNPITKSFVDQGTTIDQLLNAVTTGDFTNVKNAYGEPFTLAEQQKAMAQAENDNKAFFEQQQQKETQDAEAAMKQKQLDYQNYLETQATNFASDKTQLDQNAANQGVLFSGGRAQKERSLQTSYEKDQAYKQASVGADIGSNARDFAYKYGSPAAGGLSSYYNLGSNNYNANVATGGATPGGLSSVYNAGGSNFSGTRIAEKKTAANKGAAGLLWNKGNKLLSTGYTNQY